MAKESSGLPWSLGRLQAFQAAFDASRGFNFEQSGAREDDRALVDYAVLALAGEVGETANLVKKARRARWLGSDPNEFYKAAAGELGDVAAYLLKLADALGVDLELAYLLTMCRNCFRFEVLPREGERLRVVTICGPPGAGKTTTVRLLADLMPHYVERPEANPETRNWLDQSPSLSSFRHQRWFLQTMQEWVSAQPPSTDLLLDQDPAAIGLIYGASFYESGKLDRDEYRNLLALQLQLELEIATRGASRVVVALDAPAAILRQRLLDRDGGHAPATEWIERIREGFDDLLRSSAERTRISTDGVAPTEVAAAVVDVASLVLD